MPQSNTSGSRNKPTNKRERAYARSEGRCWYCGDYFDELVEGVPLMHLDHIIPRSQGGGDEDENLAACCPPCNLYKGTKSLEEFRLWWWRKVYTFSCVEQYFWVRSLLQELGGDLPYGDALPKFVFAFEREGWG